MAKGFPNMGGKNMNNMMKQVQKFQKDMEKMQEDLDKQEFESTAGGGVVKAVVNGKQDLLKIEIDPDVVDPEDVETLEDLILAAVRDAMSLAREKTEGEMSKLTGGLNMPGLF
ncbi:MAG: YbaB/EbfC family nucleoid-associated protein [Peptoniphilus sp.]|nr:YbaB/EbfC family nucleoid-associated protein [Peptoniphilus sp.]MDD7362716.1 YbaB/EbfC family nucleoid-associated protein [Bacillota bacterium]MDY6044590.1 YbaB/EbfC family nucleoid-associated protein [Peptoniphilus sp.]